MRILFIGFLTSAMTVFAHLVPTTPATLQGQWGGNHISLKLLPNVGKVEYDCAHGTLDEALVPDVNGDFNVRGVHVREHGGPLHPNEPLDKHPARYTGRVAAGWMILTVTLTDTNTTAGTYKLLQGSPGRVFKCL